MKYNYTVDPNKKELADFIEKALKYGIVSFDLETTGLDPYTKNVLMAQFGLQDGTVLIYTKSMPRELIELMPKVTTLGHNLKFDIKWATHKFGMAFGKIYDAMIVEIVLNQGKRIRVSLKHLSERYLGVSLDKNIRENFIDRDEGVEVIEFTEEELRYGARDVAYLFPIKEKQDKAIQDFEKEYKVNISNVVALENRFVPVCASLELEGLAIDRNKWKAFLEEEKEELLEVVHKVYRSLPDPPPVSSGLFFTDTKDEITAYSDALGLESNPKVLGILKSLGYSNLESTDSETLNKIKDKCDFAKYMLEYRGLRKRVFTYLEPMLEELNPVTGRFHADFRQLSLWGKSEKKGTDSGRIAADRVHQIPQSNKFRHCFVARPGHKIITSDYSSVEIVLGINVSNDKNLIELKRKYDDLHGAMASSIFNEPYEQVAKITNPDGSETKGPKGHLRKFSKTATFGLFYGLTPGGLKRNLLAMYGVDITLEEAEGIFNSYYQKFPQLMRTLDSFSQHAVHKGWIHDQVFGRVRFFDKDMPDWRKKNAGRNFIPQSLSASQIKLAMCRIYEEVPYAKLLLTVHDEVVAEAPDEKVEEAEKEINKIMVEAAEEICQGAIKYSVGSMVMDSWTK